MEPSTDGTSELSHGPDSDHIKLAFSAMIDMMEKVNHETAWYDHQAGDIFCFFSRSPSDIAKAKAALDAAGTLCTLDLGRITLGGEVITYV